MSERPWPIPRMQRTLQVIGDIHFGPTTMNHFPNDPKRSEKLLSDIERLLAPLHTVQIGDGVDEPVTSAFTEIVAFLKSLEARGPTTAMCGNHDIWKNAQTIAHWASELGTNLVPAPPAGLPAGNYYVDYPLFRIIFIGPEVMKNVEAPTGLKAEALASGGTFAAGKYFYKITATTSSGETIASSQVEATVVLNGSVKLTWTSPIGATGIKVYRSTTSGGQGTSPALVTTLGTNGENTEAVKSYTDTGTAVSTGAVPASNTALDALTIWLPITVTTWLEETLKATTKPCLICCHAPLKGTHPSGATTNGAETIGFGIQPDATIKAVLNACSNAKAWISGHTHAAIDHANQVMQYELSGGRKIAAINASSPAYTNTNFSPTSRICSILVTSWLDLSEPRIEVRARDHGAGIWTPLDLTTSLVKSIAVT